MEHPSEPEAPPDTPELRRRIGATLAQRLWLRFHVGVLVGTTILVGFVASMALRRYTPLQADLGSRYVVAAIVAYAWFLLSVRWWVKYFAGIRPPIGDSEEDRGRFEMRALQQQERTDAGGGGKQQSVDWGDGCLDAPGCLDVEGVLVGVVVVAAFWSILWVYSSGPLILTEIATDTLFAGGLLRWARRTEEAWMSRSISSTIIPFLIATIALLVFGLWANYRCPAATRIGEVWQCQWK